MTGTQMKTLVVAVAFLAFWICCILYIEAHSERRTMSSEKSDPSPLPEASSQDTAASDAARLEREQQSHLVADAEAERLERERLASLAVDPETDRVERERLASPAADAEVERLKRERQADRTTTTEAALPRHPPAEQVAADAPTSEYKLTAIMGGKGAYRAFINNQVYEAGDKIGTAKVLSIAAKEVTIATADGRTLKARLGGSGGDPVIRPDAAVRRRESLTRPVTPAAASVPSPGLSHGRLAYYAFNRNEGSRVSDLSDSRRDAIAENVTWTPRGKVGGAMIFSPRGSRIIASDDGLPVGDAPRSIAFWERTGPKNEILVCMLTYGKQSRGQQCAIGMDWRVGRSGINVSPGGSCNVAGTNLENERWYHVVYCYGGGGKHTVYIDGVVEPLAVREFRSFNTQLAGELLLGDSDKEAPSLDGCLDEVMIYDRVLSPAEVQQIYKGQ